MKKILSMLLVLVLALSLVACGECEHKWKAATCTERKTCKLCGLKSGSVEEHEWADATCTEPKTCSECGETEGDPLDHDTSEIDCTRCGEEIDHYELSGVDSFEYVTGVSRSGREQLTDYYVYKYKCSNYNSKYTDFLEYVEYLGEEGWNIGDLQTSSDYTNAGLVVSKNGKTITFLLYPKTATSSYELIVGFSRKNF